MTGCASDKVLNPATGRCVQRTGAVGRRLAGAGARGTGKNACSRGNVVNPRTGRCVQTGAAGRRLPGAGPDRRPANELPCPRPLDPSVELTDVLPAGIPAATERVIERVEDGFRHGDMPRPRGVTRLLGLLDGVARQKVALYIIFGAIAWFAANALAGQSVKVAEQAADVGFKVATLPGAILRNEIKMTQNSAIKAVKTVRGLLNTVTSAAKEVYMSTMRSAVKGAGFSDLGKSILESGELQHWHRIKQVLTHPSFAVDAVSAGSPGAVSREEFCAVYGHLEVVVKTGTPYDLERQKWGQLKGRFVSRFFEYLADNMRKLNCVTTTHARNH